jgi:hypothetical protein
VEDSRILRSGDDGIQLRGTDLIVSRNHVVEYFDEAIDLEGDGAIVVNGNFVARGRIGITVGGSGTAIIERNVVAEHTEVGLHIAMARGASVLHNEVLAAGRTGYILESPHAVVGNSTTATAVGMQLVDMESGEFEGNLMVTDAVGFELVDARPSRVTGNRYCGSGSALKRDDRSIALSEASVACGDSALANATAGAALPPELTVLVPRTSPRIRVSGHTDADVRFARELAQFLRDRNPGYLSVHVEGDRMWSDITPELHSVIESAGALAIGIVRMPIRRFHWATSAHPLWYLRAGGANVALVTYSERGAGARIRSMEEGRLEMLSRPGFTLERAEAHTRRAYRSATTRSAGLLRRAFQTLRGD